MTDKLEIKAAENHSETSGGVNDGGSNIVADAAPSEAHAESNQRIEMIPVSQLTPHPRNARTHPRKQVRRIADSITRYGFNNPVLVDDSDRIIAGHGRVQAAKLLGLVQVPTLRLSHMSEAEIRAYVIADNRLAEKAGWDREVLTAELECLIDLDFNTEVIGFDPGEIEIMLSDRDEDKREAAGAEDQLPASGMEAISQVGDLWVLGSHRIICGDARDTATYGLLLDGTKAQFIFTDPPYNVPIDGHVCGKGSTRHREFAMASGEMSSEAFTEFLESVFAQMVAHSENGSIHQIFMDWRHLSEMLTAGNKVYSELKNICVWVKKDWRHGLILPQPARTCLRLEIRHRTPHQYVRAWAARAQPDERVAIRRNQQHGCARHRTIENASDGEARGSCRRRTEGLLAPERPCAGSFSRLWNDRDRGRADGSPRPRHRD